MTPADWRRPWGLEQWDPAGLPLICREVGRASPTRTASQGHWARRIASVLTGLQERSMCFTTDSRSRITEAESIMIRNTSRGERSEQISTKGYNCHPR